MAVPLNFTSARQLVRAISRNTSLDAVSDFKIICGSRSWNVHRVLLCVQSKVFAAACTQGFSEAKKGERDLSYEDPSCVAAFVQFHTKFNYEEPACAMKSPEETSALRFHVQMCIFADKYEIPWLQRTAVDNFEEKICDRSFSVKDSTDAAALSYQGPKALDYIRKMIIDTAVQERLFTSFTEEPQANEIFETLMRSCPDFATDTALAKHCGSATRSNGHRDGLL